MTLLEKIIIKYLEVIELSQCTFIGDKMIMETWISKFPDLSNHIKKFIEVSDSQFTNSKNFFPATTDILDEVNGQVVFVLNNQELIEILKKVLDLSCNVINIRDYIEKQITNSIIMPRKLKIDASTFCQLNCSSCYMRLNFEGCVGKGYLTYENFRNLLSDNPFIREVELSNSGEIFLNPDLVKIFEYSYLNGVTLTALHGVNFNSVTELQLESLVKFQVDGLMVSIDGATQGTYATYRVDGSFDSVVENVKKLIEYKEKYNSLVPKIIWQYIIMEHNEHEVLLAKAKAKELGIPIWFKLTWDESYYPKNPEKLKKETGLQTLTRGEYANTMEKIYLGSTVCNEMFLSPQINWDGRLLGCSEVYMEDYGINIFDVGLRNALNKSEFIAAKKWLLHIPEDDAIPSSFPCMNCEKGRQMREIGEVLSPISSVIE